MLLTHTSPEKIEEISNNGLFGDCLFFSVDEYSMSVGNYVIYKMEINKTLEVCFIDDEKGIKNISIRFGIELDEAEDVLSGKLDISSITNDFEDEFYVQMEQGQSAKRMGYEGAEAEDEQGTCYIIPMTNRINELRG